MDPDQTPQNAASDLDIHCKLMPVYLDSKGKHGMEQLWK